ncbi:substrate-binding periplasmic protein [Rugamonas aquatica]|uniref:Transporter substrate-binding domain-containing protein n=1 Tax=Rugamonas aquatica TaxID=2743357 RepID=A0A6A7N4V9_9BURK|nr:ABC transporter substrate-binding protein [Rugamonas aquatica]MQA40134.1 transporter substrate-binding domain-containing protein [Rugamonas aquatica]
MGLRPAGAAFLLLAALLPPAAVAQPVTLRVAAQEGTEPKFIPAGPDRIIGLCVDIFRTIERIDPGLVFIGDQQWMPLIRAYHEVAIQQHDALCAVQRTEERERNYVFVDPPLFPIHYMLMVRADDDVVINNWDDVRKLGKDGMVLANRGYATTDFLIAQGGLQINASATSPAMNVQKLVAGRARFFLHRSPGLQAFIARAGATGKIRILPQVMSTAQLHMAMGRHVDPAVVARVRRALEQMEKTGELARLLKKWD